jgi:hypothetical protein
MTSYRTALRAASIVVLAGVAAPATAGDANSEKFEIELGDIPRYADEATALAACKPDGVVWADRKTGFFYPKFFADYGKTRYGAYTCYRQAKKADYWSLTPESDGGHKGREFPLFFCYSCS